MVHCALRRSRRRVRGTDMVGMMLMRKGGGAVVGEMRGVWY